MKLITKLFLRRLLAVLLPTGLSGLAMAMPLENIALHDSTSGRAPVITLNFTLSNYNGFNISCNGSADGSIDLQPSLGEPPYSFVWSTGAVTEDLSNLPAGTYTVTVTDDVGTVQTDQVTLTEPPALTISSDSIRNAGCSGSATGAVYLTYGGGVPNYNYLWSNGSTASDLTNVIAGSYTVTVTDQNNCPAQSVQVVGQFPAISLLTVPGAVLCNGTSTGSVNLTAGGGTPAFTFLWSNGASTEDLSGIPAGSYTVTVTDVTGCTATANTVVTQPSAIGLAFSTTPVSCNGGSDGSIDLTVSGGSPAYTYLWSNGSTFQDPSGLIAGTYTVTVTDAAGCTATANTVVTQPSAIGLGFSPTPVSCNGGSDGSIDLTVSGGSPAYTYLWSNGSTFQDPSGLIAGSYTVTVTDAALCTRTGAVTVTQPTSLQLTTSSTPVSCNGGSNGAIDLTVAGGTAGYTYLWNTGSSVQDLSGVVSGTYTVTVTDANACTAQVSASVSQPATLSLAATPSGVNCNGGSNGSIDLTVSGGTTAYSYLWSNGSTVQDPSGLVAGIYTVSVTDANFCTAVTSTTITQPPLIQITLTPVAGSCNAANGSITSIVSGGTPGYSYLWNTGATVSSIAGLPAGNYTLTITDVRGCTRSQSATVLNTGNPVPALVFRKNVSCNGGSDGLLDINVIGGTSPFTYQWSNGALTQDITGLSLGSYTVTVTDQNFCTATASWNITQPTLITSSATSSAVSCNGGSNGSINLSVSGGTPGYTFLWSNGFTGEDPSGLAAGSYLVTITDANGCTRNRTVSITQPTAITTNTSSTQTGCGASTGTATVSASGGTPGYTYLWSTGGTSTVITGLAVGIYTVTVTDQNGCTRETSTSVTATNGPAITNAVITGVSCVGSSDGGVNISIGGGGAPPFTYLWSNGAVTQDINNVSTGTYTVTVTDINNCTVSSSYFVGQPTPISATPVITNVNCNGASTGAIQLTVSGGSGLYTYLWNTGSVTRNLSSIPAGNYTITITDNNGCSASQSFTVTQNAALSLSPALTNPLCNGSANGSINLGVSGGTPGYTYQWSNGFTGQDPAGLTAGTYTVTVTDANSCTGSSSWALNNPAPVSTSALVSPDTCGKSRGAVSVVASGGAAPYTYLWNNGATQASLNNLSAGSYTLTVTDVYGCTGLRTVLVNNLAGPSISSAIVDSVSCNGGADGRIDITVVGGSFPYAYTWSNGQTTQDLINIASNSYTVTVSDQNACTVSGSYFVAQPTAIQVAIGTTPSTCGSANGSLQAVASGGVPGYSYQWSNGNTSANNTNIPGGIYTLTVTDFKGCVAVFQQVLSNTSGVVIDSASVTNVLCNGGSTGAVNLFLSGGSLPYSFQWSNGTTAQNLINIPAGSYTVTVTDGLGCSAVRSVSVTQPTFLSAVVSSTPSFCGQSTGTASVTPGGGVPPYAVLWSGGQTTLSISGLTAGTYSVTVTDSRGCTRQRNAVVPLSNGPVISLVAQTNVSCVGGNDGALDVSVTGGTAPYSYSWSTGALSQDINNLNAGTYTVFVTDDNSCSDSAQFVVAEPLPFTLNAIVSGSGCGQNNGAVALTVTGGTPTYTYQWSGGQQTAAVSNLLPGIYTVTISDSKGCDTSRSFVISALPGPSVVVDSIRNVACFGGVNGRIFISASGGTLPYTYLWSDGSTSQDRVGLAAGTYTVTVTATGGCTASTSTTLTQNTAITPTFTANQATCNQANGSISVSVSGGVSPYALLWETGATSNGISALSAGFYSITITDFLGCIKRDSVQLINAGIPQVSLVSAQEPSCFGLSNGTITVSVSAGVFPYVFQWSNGDQTALADSLQKGAYSVTVTDNSGCSTVSSFNLIEPDSITLTIQSTASNCNLSNGSATAFASGGTGLFSYNWSSGVQSAAAGNLTSGTYIVTVSDQNACAKSASIVVADIPAPVLQLDSVANVRCFGGATGSIYVTASGNTGPFAFEWSTGQLTQNILNLNAGLYTVIVTDTAGCTDTLSATITQPSALSLLLSVTNSSCGQANGSISAAVSGGSPAYSYLWSNGSINPSIGGLIASVYSITVTDLNGCTDAQSVAVSNQDGALVGTDSVGQVSCAGLNDGYISAVVLQGTGPFTYQWSSGSTSALATNLAAGIYTLTVIDGNNCPTFYVDTISEPLPFLITATITPASCSLSNGVISLLGAGGTAPYTYLWSTGAASSVVSGLGAGTYSVTLTDAVGCTYDSSFVLGNTGVPSVLIVAVDSVSCFGLADGSINIDVNGGLPPFTYTWVNTSQNSQDVFNLAAGSYSVIVTDASGCTATQLFSVGQPPDISISFTQIVNAACGQSNGSITALATGGIPGYGFSWSTGVNTPTVSNLSAGSYTLTVTDSKGCTRAAIGNVNNLSGPVITGVDSVNVNCPGGNNGSILITASGVSLPLSYSWSGLPDTTASLSNLSAGSYTVTVRDAAGCLALRTITIIQPAPFSINAVVPQNNPPFSLSCNGSADGSVFLSVTGGTAPYQFVWSNGAITQNIQSLPAGPYTVFITDSRNCSASNSFNLTEPPVITANAGSDFIVCADTVATLSAGVPSYGTGYWQVLNSAGNIVFSDSTSPSTFISGLALGDNVLLWTVTDGKCDRQDQLIVTVTTEVSAIVGADRSVCTSTVNLNATRPEFGSGIWRSLNTLVQIEDSTRANTTAAGLAFGVNLFQWTVVNGGCRDSAVLTIIRRDSIDCLSKIELPTAFSPNEDGFNDFLLIKGLDEYPDNEIMIFNRWGQVVFRQNSYRNDWRGIGEDGNPVVDGTYFIVLKVGFLNRVFNTYLDLRR